MSHLRLSAVLSISVFVVDGQEREFNSIILATGYKSNVPSCSKAAPVVFTDHNDDLDDRKDAICPALENCKCFQDKCLEQFRGDKERGKFLRRIGEGLHAFVKILSKNLLLNLSYIYCRRRKGFRRL